MTAQPTLFDAGAAGAVRHEDPVTSVAAARAQRGGARVAILDAFHRAGQGMTDDELVTALNEGLDPADQWHPPTVKTARSRLERDLFLVATGVTRPSRLGHEMQVWALHPQFRRTETVRDAQGRVA